MHEDNTSWQTHLSDWNPPFLKFVCFFSFHPVVFAFYQSGEGSYSAMFQCDAKILA